MFNKDEITRIMEAKAWTIKYLMAVSVKLKFNRTKTKGIKLRILISSPSHARNHEVAETEIKEPRTKKVKNIP